MNGFLEFNNLLRSKIATEGEAYSIGGIGTPDENKCTTKSRAEELGCTVDGSYTSNQLVQLEDLDVASIAVQFTGLLLVGRNISIQGGINTASKLPATINVKPGNSLRVIYGFGTSSGTVTVTSKNCKLNVTSTEFEVISDYEIRGSYSGAKQFGVYDIQEGATVHIV